MSHVPSKVPSSRSSRAARGCIVYSLDSINNWRLGVEGSGGQSDEDGRKGSLARRNELAPSGSLSGVAVTFFSLFPLSNRAPRPGDGGQSVRVARADGIIGERRCKFRAGNYLRAFCRGEGSRGGESVEESVLWGMEVCWMAKRWIGWLARVRSPGVPGKGPGEAGRGVTRWKYEVSSGTKKQIESRGEEAGKRASSTRNSS